MRGDEINVIYTSKIIVKVIKDRKILTDKETELLEKYGEGKEDVPKPDWGGYRVVPQMVEFWQGQSTRIHDRIRFRRKDDEENIDPDLTVIGDQGWLIERLAP